MRRILLWAFPFLLIFGLCFVAETEGKIAFIRNQRVWLMNHSGSNQKQVPNSQGIISGTISWSRDGRKLAFWQKGKGKSSYLKVFDLTTWQGKTVFTETFGESYRYEPPSFSKDGKSLYFGRHKGEFGDVGAHQVKDLGIWKVDISTKKASRIHPGLKFGFTREISVSPDGKWIAFYAYIWEECGALGYLRINGKGLTIRKDISIRSFSWAPDSQSIAVVTVSEDDPYTTDSIAIFDLKNKRLRKILKSPALDFNLPPIFSSDGRRILYKKGWDFIEEINRDGSNRRVVIQLAWPGFEIYHFSIHGEEIAMEAMGRNPESHYLLIGNQVIKNAKEPIFSPQ